MEFEGKFGWYISVDDIDMVNGYYFVLGGEIIVDGKFV